MERSRRQKYRHDFSGKLPWEVRGLNVKTGDVVPEMALEVLDRDQGLPELGRETLDCAEPLPTHSVSHTADATNTHSPSAVFPSSR